MCQRKHALIDLDRATEGLDLGEFTSMLCSEKLLSPGILSICERRCYDRGESPNSPPRCVFKYLVPFPNPPYANGVARLI